MSAIIEKEKYKDQKDTECDEEGYREDVDAYCYTEYRNILEKLSI